MGTNRLRLFAAFTSAAVIVLVFAGTAFGTPGAGVISAPILARGGFSEQVDVKVKYARDGSINVSNAPASGDVVVRQYAGASVAVRTVSGDVRLGLPSGIRVEPQISTLSGKVDLPAGTGELTTGERRVVRVRLRTVSGDIRIERA